MPCPLNWWIQFMHFFHSIKGERIIQAPWIRLTIPMFHFPNTQKQALTCSVVNERVTYLYSLPKILNVDCTRKNSGNQTIFIMLRILEVHNIGYMGYGNFKKTSYGKLILYFQCIGWSLTGWKSIFSTWLSFSSHMLTCREQKEKTG